MITYVVCFLIMSGQMHKSSGRLIESKGDNWLVAFKEKTMWLNSNACLVKGPK